MMLNKKFIIFIALLIIIVPSLVIGSDPFNSGKLLYSLFLDWLNGRSMGIITIRVHPVDGNGSPVSDDFMVYLHNFTDYASKIHSERIYIGRPPVSVKVWRLLDNSNKWKEHVFTIVLVGSKYGGATHFRVRPEKPIVVIDIKVVVHKLPKPSPILGALIMSEQNTLIHSELKEGLVGEATELTNAVQLHTIPGITARVHFYSGNYLYFSQKYRYIWWDTLYDQLVGVGSWQTAGDVATICNNNVATGSISNGVKRWVKVNVHYRLERWLVQRAQQYFEYYELVTPVSFGGWNWGATISCSLCEGKPTGLYNEYPRGTSIPFEIIMGSGKHEIESFGAKVSFTVEYGPVSVTVEVWKEISKGDAVKKPAIEVVNVDWKSDTLYVFDAGTNFKVIHFTWTPP